MVDTTVECEVCHERAVVHVRDESAGVLLQVWVCGRCGDMKRWCPRCDQGWIRRCRVEVTGDEFYSCDECDATWPSVAAVAPPGTDRETYLQQRGIADAWRGVAEVRERETVPPAA